MKRFCWMCGQPYEAHRMTSKYCSSTCRSRAYRERNKRYVNPKDTLFSRLATKHVQTHVMKCCHCHATYTVNGAQKMSMYCSKTCRNHAYQERRAYKLEQKRLQRQGVMRLIGALESAGAK